MTNKTITLSRELVEQIHKELTSGAVSIGTGAQVRAALAEPVPPAGGEVEVLEPIGKIFDEKYNSVTFYRQTGDSTKRYHPAGTEFVALDTANAIVTRLQAEVERLTEQRDERRAMVIELSHKCARADIKIDTMRNKNNELNDTVATLHTELTEALELLNGALEHLPFSDARHRIEAYLSNQSVPAAKCSICQGRGTVDDGEITCSAGGIPFENGPIKCVKDCPACSGQPAPVAEGVTWKAQGDANFYTLLKDGDWFAAIQINGRYLLADQEAFLNEIFGPGVKPQ